MNISLGKGLKGKKEDLYSGYTPPTLKMACSCFSKACPTLWYHFLFVWPRTTPFNTADYICQHQFLKTIFFFLLSVSTTHILTMDSDTGFHSGIVTLTLIFSICQKEGKQSQNKLGVEQAPTKIHLGKASVILSGRQLQLQKAGKRK